MKTDKIIRIRLTTYRRIRKNFKALPNETLVDYFQRLSLELERYKRGLIR